MCIIIYKSNEAEEPSKDIIDNCWENNPDGAGVMILRHGGKYVDYKKGFMTIESLRTALSELCVQKNDFVAYHFRIATSGGVNAGMTHPFPASANPDHLRSTKGRFKRVFMHNGVLDSGTQTLSDTALYVKHKLSKVKSICQSKDVIAKDTIGSRTLTFDANEGILCTGSWTEDSGLSFSNSTYKQYTPTLYSGNKWWSSRRYSDYGDYGSYFKEEVYYDSKKGEYTDGYKRYYKLSHYDERWSDEAFDTLGCGYCYSGTMFCPGCEFQSVCQRGSDALANNKFPAVCEDGVQVPFRTAACCKRCLIQQGCRDRTYTPYRKEPVLVPGVGNFISVY